MGAWHTGVFVVRTRYPCMHAYVKKRREELLCVCGVMRARVVTEDFIKPLGAQLALLQAYEDAEFSLGDGLVVPLVQAPEPPDAVRVRQVD